MASTTIHVASGQIICRPGDIEGNLAQIEQLTRSAAMARARLILFGEAALTGYLFSDKVLDQAVRIDGPVMDRLRRLAARTEVVVVPGAFERSADGLHVSQFVVYPDGNILAQRKFNLTEDEKRSMVPGPEERLLFKVGGVTTAIGICADNGSPNIHRATRARGCGLWLWPAAGGGFRNTIFKPQDLSVAARRKDYMDRMNKVSFPEFAVEKAGELGLAVVSANLCGDDGEHKFHPGHSTIVDCHGRVAALQPGEYIAEWQCPCFIHSEIETLI